MSINKLILVQGSLGLFQVYLMTQNIYDNGFEGGFWIINLFGVLSCAFVMWLEYRSHKKKIERLTHSDPEIEAIVASIDNMKLVKTKKGWWPFNKWVLTRFDKTTYTLWNMHKLGQTEVIVTYANGNFLITRFALIGCEPELIKTKAIVIPIADVDYYKQIRTTLVSLIAKLESDTYIEFGHNL